MAQQKSLATVTSELVADRGYEWAWTEFKATIVGLAEAFALERVLEVGGGRGPMFSSAEANALGIDYSINDIAQEELDASPADFAPDHKVLFDIGGPLTPEGQFDLVFSKTVLEHVTDTMRAHRNTYQLLRTGGVALHFYPTLYSPPFVANWLLPERISSVLLRHLGATHKKFPARYDHCTSTRSLAEDLRRVGYSEVELVPFWGHGYFDRLPVLREVDRWLATKARERDFRLYSSYCYAIARK